MNNVLSNIRFGLCCIFKDSPIKFRQTTAKNLGKLARLDQLLTLSELCLDNSTSLLAALKRINELEIKAFRISSPFLPLYTHPQAGYKLEMLADYESILLNLKEAGKYAKKNDIRLSFHPDQFNILSSPRPEVVENSIKELEYQCMLSEIVGAENVNMHMGGVYGDKTAAIKRFEANYQYLPELIKKHLVLENDDISYTVKDLLPTCEKLKIPLTYDVHHHRCNPDGLSVKTATDLSIKTWHAINREAHFHISSPKNGWESKNPKSHADYINVEDFPEEWLELTERFTLDIEAKAKELAIIKLRNDLLEKYLENKI
jgi:UV DNA damage endonuclease